uniref:SRP54-type proteins GTP-binding domain-containing protein n=1 Tax=Pavo cristatus TaxID=9049 RepID=A0A8C9EQ74_PAVCR
MLDFFTIFSKGGLVLWCFQGVRGPASAATAPVNALIRSVLLQERGGNNSFTHEALTLKYKLDNQFELVFVVSGPPWAALVSKCFVFAIDCHAVCSEGLSGRGLLRLGKGRVLREVSSWPRVGDLGLRASLQGFPGATSSPVIFLFPAVTSTVKQALQEALVQILQPQRRVDVLRDVMDAQRHRRPYVVTFCGVNGVGKSTNLAKISFWLIENGFSVLIAACDTFRAGAVEQLRTHTRRLNALHPPESHGGRPMVQLYEKGYGKDAAGIAMEAISYARNQGFDVVLVDTAGRMQDNAPLMTALAKLIAVNAPDLVLFVGEALVGNEAVDQLVKFNKALADHSMAQTPRLIDGIVLTKFDTIDDKVGAAISMTYITSKPIVFVGTGQTYCDLRSLNAKAVVAALMKA